MMRITHWSMGDMGTVKLRMSLVGQTRRFAIVTTTSADRPIADV